MNKKELLSGLRNYQSWRKGADIEMMQPKEVTTLIDSAISVIEKCNRIEVNKSLKEKI